ncbi:MAG TPA: AAA family ATPase [Solirubrobacterales bacterium]|jgi:predicted ATPase|nr:AAA family ATPase [Solirubrobacterales bacterium]
MRLDELTIGSFKNLRDLRINFDEESPYTVLVGENGTGKSNLLEALTYIFRNLDLGLDAPFDFLLKYSCRDSELEIRGVSGNPVVYRRRPMGNKTYERLTKRQFMAEDERGPLYRPAFVFGYYSGPGDRLASLYSKHQEQFYNWIIRPPERRDRQISDPNILRRLFYAQDLHGQFALIAFFMESEGDAAEDRRFLQEHLSIDGLDSVLFALKQPPWQRPKSGGDDRFWGAQGEVQAFLDRLHGKALLPMRLPRRMPTGFGKLRSVENLYLYLPGTTDLESVYREYGDQYRFFTALESTHLSGLLAEVRTRVRISAASGGGAVTYRDLSDGEQQLLLVLGLLKFTARSESLFLLDEPDTHLNPAWSTQYLEFLNRFIPDPRSCHIVMASHDPLVFSSLHRSQVQIMECGDDGVVRAEPPSQDPRGMGIQAILASDLFRLPSGGLDSPTVRDLDKQRRLGQAADLAPEQEHELDRVNRRLRERGFWKSARDPIYQLFREKFVPRWLESEASPDDRSEQLTVDEVHRREAIADDIAAEIAAELAAERAE